MKILMITTVPIRKNGITRVINNIIENVSGLDFQFDVICPCVLDEESADVVKKNNGSLYIIPRQESHIVKYVVSVYKTILKHSYDIIHIHANSSTCILEIIAANFAKCENIIVHAHNNSCKKIIIHKILKPLFNLCNLKRIACSDEAGKFLFGKKQFFIFKNAIDIKKFQFDEENRNYVREKLRISKEQVLIGHVGLFNNQKNQEFLIKIFKEYVNECDAKLVLIGDGENKKRISQLTQEYHLTERVIFLGFVNDVHRYFSAFDYFVFPSKFEGLGIVLIEAQASGLYCFASNNVPSMANVADKILFFPLEYGVKYWASQIPQKISPQRKLMSQEAIELIKNKGYDLKFEINKLKQYYETIIRQVK